MAYAEKAPSYQWFPRDCAADERVIEMTWEEYGIYRFLLDHQSLHGSIPAEPERIATLLRRKGFSAKRFVTSTWPALAPCFRTDIEPGRLVNRKLRRVMDERVTFIKKKSEDGKKGAQAKKDREAAREASRGGSAEAVPPAQPQAVPVAELQLPVPDPVPTTPSAIATGGAAAPRPASKPRSERDTRLEALAQIYRDNNLEPPRFNVLGTWLANYGDDADRLAYQLREMAADDTLRKEPSYAWKVLRSKLSDPWPPRAPRRNGYDPGAIPETPPPPRIEALRAEFTRAVRNLCAAAERPVDQEAIERAGQLDEAGLKQFEAAWMKQARPWLEASGAWR